MDWTLAIDRNRAILLRIVAMLAAMAEMADGAMPETLPRHRHIAVRRILRAAESALRRLIVIAARRIADIPPPVGVHMYGLGGGETGSKPSRKAAGGSADTPVPPFPLTDPVKRFSFAPPPRSPKSFPRITVIGLSEPTPVPAGWYRYPDDEIDARPLCRRILSMGRALCDIGAEARRLARLQQRRDRTNAKAVRRSPIRVGPPPGRRARRNHEIDEVLADLHGLAMGALSPDSS
ncbi:hypothetical protein [Oricola indica]|jgi:hypothetical protein|uniref:hypothetical protein n=1 Tax=Oricola indica TaxID=2872591 RepID=UPI001CBD7204|nr:hypothetical protein [Oricola indica]